MIMVALFGTRKQMDKQEQPNSPSVGEYGTTVTQLKEVQTKNKKERNRKNKNNKCHNQAIALKLMVVYNEIQSLKMTLQNISLNKRRFTVY